MWTALWMQGVGQEKIALVRERSCVRPPLSQGQALFDAAAEPLAQMGSAIHAQTERTASKAATLHGFCGSSVRPISIFSCVPLPLRHDERGQTAAGFAGR